MDRGIIARRYAQALWMFASKNGSEDKVYAEILTLADTLTAYPAVARVLNSRMVAAQKREKMVATLLGEGQSGSTLRRFVQVLIERNREEFLREICFSYQNIYRREKKLLNVMLTTATPVNENVQQHIRQEIEKATGKTVSFTTDVDLSVVGGYILRWDTYRVDASVAGRLRQVHKKLLEGEFVMSSETRNE